MTLGANTLAPKKWKASQKSVYHFFSVDVLAPNVILMLG